MGAGLKHRAWLAVLLCAPGLTAAAPAKPTGKLAVSSTRPLVFGKFAAGAGGTITIAPNGARSRGGGVILLPSSASSSAGFLVNETKADGSNNVIVITLPANNAVTLKSGINSMRLTNFTSDRGAAATLQGNTLTLSVGATLNVGANQPPGNYTGSIPLTVEYQ